MVDSSKMDASSANENKRINHDVAMMIKCKTHIGKANINHMMKPYVFKRTAEKVNLIDIFKQYEKLMVAARVCATVKNPADILVVSQKPLASRAIFKFAHYTGATHQVNRWTAGTLTNQITKQYLEPQVIIVADPKADCQAIKETCYANVPVIALCNTDSRLENVDIAIPCNNNYAHSLGIIFWMLAREILILRGELSKDEEWGIIPDLFFHTEEEQKVDDEQQYDQQIEEEVMEEVVPEGTEGLAGEW